MTETNGWPDKPGVPLNPEKDEWHWFKTPDGELVPYNWRPAGECERGRWASEWIYDKEDDWNPKDCTYLGPCLTPDEATALQARVAALERLVGLADSWITAALECKDWHWDADQHEAATHTRDELRAALEGKKDE